MPKITEYGQHSGAPASNDQLVIVDVSDVSMASTGTTKRIDYADLLSGISGNSVKIDVTQSNNGFAAGDAIRFNGSSWVKAQANNATNSLVLGIVQSASQNAFTAVLQGVITGLSGLSAGSLYYLSSSGGGGLTTTAPTGGNSVQKPILLATSATGGIVANWLGYLGGGSSGSGDSAAETVSQVAHGFAVGDLIRHNGTIYVKAQADTIANSEAVGVVSVVPTSDSFTVVYSGRISTLSGLTAGTVYFLSSSVAGGYTDTEPSISKPMFVATSTTSAIVVNYRGIVGASSVGSYASWDKPYRTLYVDAAAMAPATTNGPTVSKQETSTNAINIDRLGFDGSTQQIAWFKWTAPEEYDGGTIKAKFTWDADTAGSGGVVWDIAARALGDGDTLDQAMGTAQKIADTVQGVGYEHITAATPAITIAGTPAAGKVVVFRVRRAPSDASDTMSQTAWLHGVTIQWRETALAPSAW